MRFNDAVRAGIKRLPVQVFRHLWSDDKKGGCILGAAYDGMQLSRSDVMFKGLGMSQLQVWELTGPYTCPFSCDRGYWGTINTLADVIVHLNNDHQWTREAIAEWADPRPELHVGTKEVEGRTLTYVDVQQPEGALCASP